MPCRAIQSQQAPDRPRFLSLLCFPGHTTLAFLSLSVPISNVRPEGVLTSECCCDDNLGSLGQKASMGCWAHGGVHSRHWLLGSWDQHPAGCGLERCGCAEASNHYSVWGRSPGQFSGRLCRLRLQDSGSARQLASCLSECGYPCRVGEALEAGEGGVSDPCGDCEWGLPLILSVCRSALELSAWQAGVCGSPAP